MKQYYININNRQEGPFEESVILAGVASGEYDANAYIWCEGMEKWETISEHFPSDVTPSPMERVDAISDNKQTLCISSTEEEKHTRNQFKAKVQQGIQSLKKGLAASAECCRKWYGVSNPIIKEGIGKATHSAKKHTSPYFAKFKKKQVIGSALVASIVLITGTIGYLLCKSPEEELLQMGIEKQHYQRALVNAASSENVNLLKLLLETDTKFFPDTYRTAFHTAAKRGNIECIKVLLDEGVDINGYDGNKRTALQLAAAKNHTECVSYLLESGADPKKGHPLADAAGTGNYKTVSMLIEAGAQINNPEGSSALYQAARKGDSKCVKLLIKHGAIVNPTKDKPLKTAISYGHENIVKILLDAGANVNASDDYAGTPIYQAATHGQSECLALLIKAGADINKETQEIVSYGETDRLDFYYTPLEIAAENGHIDCINKLLETDSIDTTSWTPLSLAVLSKDVSEIKKLIKKNTDLNQKDRHGVTALHFAAACGYDEIVELLLDAGADVNAKDYHCGVYLSLRTMYSIGRNTSAPGYYKQREKSLSKMKIINGNGRSPLHLAARQGHCDTLKLLIKGGAKVNDSAINTPSPICIAASKGCSTCVQMLIKAGAELDPANEIDTPLVLAAKNGSADCVKLLLDNGANPNGGLHDRPLYAALENEDYPECVKLLLNAGADPNVSKKKIEGVLFVDVGPPIFNADLPSLKLLLEAGANPNAIHGGFGTLLHRAARSENVELIKLLLAAGADPSVTCNDFKDDGQYKTPLDFAKETGNQECIHLLEAAK